MTKVMAWQLNEARSTRHEALVDVNILDHCLARPGLQTGGALFRLLTLVMSDSRVWKRF